MPASRRCREKEAKSCLMSAKLQLNSARNLKTDIKLAVLAAIDKLYLLVKGAEEMNREQGRERQEMSVTEGGAPQGCEIMEKLQEHSALLRENGKRLEELKESMERRERSVDKIGEALERQHEALERATYASVAAAGHTKEKTSEPAALHSVVVSSRDENATGEQVLETVRRAINAKEGWVQVERVRRAKDRKIIMGCRSEEDRNKIKARLEEVGDRLIVEEVKNKDPLLILRDVLNINSDDDVLMALRNQNRSVFGGLDDGELRLQIKYKKKARNPNSSHIVLGVSPKVWARAIEARKLHIDLQRVTVEDQSPLVQCTRCLGYGHSKRFCKEAEDLCSHCGGPHTKDRCQAYQESEPAKCVNCVRAEILPAHHHAFSGECPIRRKWDAMARAAVAYS